MPLQRRLPKVGFKSRVGRTTAEIRLSELAKLKDDTINLEALKRANLVAKSTNRAKVIASGSIDRALTLQGLGVTKGARAAIEAVGGRIED